MLLRLDSNTLQCQACEQPFASVPYKKYPRRYALNFGDALKRVAECELKLNALEEVLEKQNAALCAAWQGQSITREGHEPNLGKLREKLILAA